MRIVIEYDEFRWFFSRRNYPISAAVQTKPLQSDSPRDLGAIERPMFTKNDCTRWARLIGLVIERRRTVQGQEVVRRASQPASRDIYEKV